MNVIVSNKYQSLLTTLDIDIIKNINGEFEVQDLVKQFTNFYYNKMVLDITALKDYQEVETLQNLSVNMDVSNIIILLDDSEVVNSPRYLSSLISMGIYNFTRNVDAIAFLIDNPNTYKDVAQYHQLSSVSESDTSNNNSNNNVVVNDMVKQPVRVIGIKNVTNHAGATTFTYLLKKQLEKKYDCVAVEVDEHDFIYFNDQTLKTTSNLDLPAYIAMNSELEVILVDLNDRGSVNSCTEVLYLIEPGLIKLNKLIRKDKRAFEKLQDKKIILNRSILSAKDIKDFEYESKSKVFFNIPNLDDKLDNQKVLDAFLVKMGFTRFDVDNDDKNGKLFTLFK